MKKKQKKIEKLNYETDNVLRWNMCQKLAKVIYRSTLNNHQIMENIELVLNDFTKLEK